VILWELSTFMTFTSVKHFLASQALLNPARRLPSSAKDKGFFRRLEADWTAWRAPLQSTVWHVLSLSDGRATAWRLPRESAAIGSTVSGSHQAVFAAPGTA
jgi:hypothetical protein